MKRFLKFEPDYDINLVPEDIKLSAQVWYIEKNMKMVLFWAITFLILIFLLSMTTENLFFLKLIMAGIVIMAVLIIVLNSFLFKYFAEKSLNKKEIMKKFLSAHIYPPNKAVLSKYDLVRYYELLQEL